MGGKDDDQGRLYDAKGNLVNWWIPADAENFVKLGQCIVDQFNGYVALDYVHENGKLGEAEAIADLGGVTIAHRAFLTDEAKSGEPIGGMTLEQHFFVAFAQFWEQNIRPEEARTLALGNAHPLGKFRVIGPFGNLPDFAKAYQCPANTAMVHVWPCKIW